MSGMSIGLATFNSCNKAGSIPHFTKHLTRYPHDYTARTWRGKAYSIIGKKTEAKEDYTTAFLVSSDARKSLSQARMKSIDEDLKQYVGILQNTTRQYPNCAEAWFELGSCFQFKLDSCLTYLEKAIQLATSAETREEPWFPWCNNMIGDILYQRQQVHDARKHYVTAVQSANTLTVGYLGLSRCDILNDNVEEAKSNFLTAKSLNPKLVTWLTFEDFSQEVIAKHGLEAFLDSLASVFSRMHFDPDQTMSKAANDNKPRFVHDDEKKIDSARLELLTGARPRGGPRNQISRSSNSNLRGGSGGGRRGSGKGGGGRGRGRGRGSGDGGGSDDDDDVGRKKETGRKKEIAKKTWEELRKEAPQIMKYGNLRFYQSKCHKCWYSKIDHGRHGGAFFKKYHDRRSTIVLKCSVDEKLNEIPEKHESEIIPVIKKSKMNRKK